MPLAGADLHFRFRQVIAAGTTGAAIIIPAGIREITATLQPGGGGSGTVFHSTSDQNLIEDTPNHADVIWVPWDPGSVSAVRSATLLSPVSAIRASAVVVAAVLEIIGFRRWN